jgi:uncharacterized phage-associated protein
MFNRGKYSVTDIANWFLNENRKQMNFEDSEFITNLKLQKLLYYAQGCYLAQKGESLFKEDFLAWEHGPVIRTIYDKFKKFGANGIQYEDDYEEKIDEDTIALLKRVYNKFGQYTAWKLRDMTHQETPWKETQRNSVIDKKIIKDYFEENYNNI